MTPDTPNTQNNFSAGGFVGPRPGSEPAGNVVFNVNPHVTLDLEAVARAMRDNPTLSRQVARVVFEDNAARLAKPEPAPLSLTYKELVAVELCLRRALDEAESQRYEPFGDERLEPCKQLYRKVQEVLCAAAEARNKHAVKQFDAREARRATGATS